jgi:hypothetical protein
MVTNGLNGAHHGRSHQTDNQHGGDSHGSKKVSYGKR